MATLISIAEGADPTKVAGTYVGDFGGEGWSEAIVVHFYQDGNTVRGVSISSLPAIRYELKETVSASTYRFAGSRSYFDQTMGIPVNYECTEQVELTFDADFRKFKGTGSQMCTNGLGYNYTWSASRDSLHLKSEEEYCKVTPDIDSIEKNAGDFGGRHRWFKDTGPYSTPYEWTIAEHRAVCSEWGEIVGLDEAVQHAVNFDQRLLGGPSGVERQAACEKPRVGDPEENRRKVMKFAKCQNCNLQGVTISGKVKGRVDLSCSDLRNAVLKKLNLDKPNLQGVLLNGASLVYVEFKDANLVGADLSGVTADPLADGWYGPLVSSGSDLTDANLTDARLLGARMLNVTLTGAILTRTDLSTVDLSGSDLSGVDFTSIKFDEHTKLGSSNLSNANLSGLNLRDGRLLEGYGGHLTNLTGANLSGTDLQGAYLTYTNLSGQDLSGQDLTGASLGGANLTGAKLSSANLSKADLSRANLTGANLTSAILRGANLSYTDLTGANLEGADLTGTIFSTTKMPDGTINDSG